MYTKGELVWAKIKGFPWWPAVVAKVIEDKEDSANNFEVVVNFIGENSHARLHKEKIAKYDEKYAEYAKMKKKKLLESINIADRIRSGESTYEHESRKLTDRSSHSQASKKRKDSQRSEKSPGSDFDPVLNRSESDMMSMEGLELGSPNERGRRKSKDMNKKEDQRVLGGSKGSTDPFIPKSPLLKKNAKGSSKDLHDSDGDQENFYEPKPSKAVKVEKKLDKLNKSDSKKDLTFSLEKKPPKITAPPLVNNTSNVNSTTNTTSYSPRNVSSPSESIFVMNRFDHKEFETLYNLIIDQIVNNKPRLGSIIGVEKSIENVISKINPETVSINEILENDLGKNLHTLLILLDELQRSDNKFEPTFESELNVIKERVLSFIDVIKGRLVLHYIENGDYCSVWVKRLEQKREEKEMLNHISHDVKKSNKMEEIHSVTNMEVENDKPSSKIEIEEEKNKENYKVREATPETASNDFNNFANSITPNSTNLQLNFDDYRFEEKKKNPLSDKNAKLSTSTKVTKPIYSTSETKKNENKQKENIVDPILRKKICMKISRTLQEKYNLSKEQAQDLTIRVEAKIRQINPDMTALYKSKVLVILKLLKFSSAEIQEYGTSSSQDFSILESAFDRYQSENGPEPNSSEHNVEDSPKLTSQVSKDSTLLNGRMSELK